MVLVQNGAGSCQVQPVFTERVPGEPCHPLQVGTDDRRLGAIRVTSLEPFDLPLRTTLKMLLLKADDAKSQQGEFEIWEVEGDTIRPLDIVEEALIMALPLSIVHQSRDECGPLADNVTNEKIETVRPFSDLRAQMNKAND